MIRSLRFLAVILGGILLTAPRAVGDGGIFKGYVVVNRGSGNEFFNLSGGTGTNFNGLDMGTFAATSTLLLNGYEVNTFKNGSTNITGAFGNYRVYQGSPSGSFTENSVPFNSDLGGGDQKWLATGQNTNLLRATSTLSRDAGTYGIQVYLRASANDGDKFMSNGGSNYTASFTVNATDYTWTGGAGSGATGTATNWSGGVTPGNGHNLHFAGSTQTNVTSSFTRANAIFFDAGASAFTVGGSNLTLGNVTGIGGPTDVDTTTGSRRGIANNSSNVQTVNNNITFGTTSGTSVTFNANTAALVLGGTISTNGNPMTITGANNTTFNGVVSGTGSVIKSGNGTAFLAGTYSSNGHTGSTTINGGTLSANVGSLVQTSGITVNSGGTLLLSGEGRHIGANTGVTLAGGKFATGGFSEPTTSAGTGNIGVLTLTATSMIDFGSSNTSVLEFSGVTHTSGVGMLQIINWNGTPIVGGTGDRLLFVGNGVTDFFPKFAQSDVSFNGTPGYVISQFSGFYEITEIPEPSSWIAGLLSVAALGFTQRRRLGSLVFRG